MTQTPAAYGTTLLRVTLGFALIAHGPYLKPFVFGMDGASAFFDKLGLPGPLAWAVMAVEAVTGLMLVLGLQTRYAALAALPVLLGATWDHSGNGWLFTKGGWEYPAFWALALAAQALLGNGALALSNALGHPDALGRFPKAQPLAARQAA